MSSISSSRLRWEAAKLQATEAAEAAAAEGGCSSAGGGRSAEAAAEAAQSAAQQEEEEEEEDTSQHFTGLIVTRLREKRVKQSELDQVRLVLVPA